MYEYEYEYIIYTRMEKEIINYFFLFSSFKIIFIRQSYYSSYICLCMIPLSYNTSVAIISYKIKKEVTEEIKLIAG